VRTGVNKLTVNAHERDDADLLVVGVPFVQPCTLLAHSPPPGSLCNDSTVSRILFIALETEGLTETKGLFDIHEHQECHRSQFLV
jgi:hypothetical protein